MKTSIKLSIIAVVAIIAYTYTASHSSQYFAIHIPTNNQLQDEFISSTAISTHTDKFGNLDVTLSHVESQKHTPNLTLIYNQIEKSEYFFQTHGDSNYFQCPNRAQNLRATVGNTAFEIEPRVDTSIENHWEIKFHLVPTQFYSTNPQIETPNPSPGANKIQFNTTDNITTEYINDINGIRQNFYVMRPENNSDRLVITQKIETALELVKENNSSIAFYNQNTKIVTYSDLHVWDADSIVLTAQMDIYTQNEQAYISIEVNTENAKYPITIDPVLADADIILEQDQASSQFGTMVQSAGSVDGDIYEDIIISAPYFDNGETNEGRVFLYKGSSMGFSATPSWTVESNQANAYFGKSIASNGDINNDGYSDIIIGAPNFDNGQTDEGSVFVYYGTPTVPSTTPTWKYESNQASSLTGTAVSISQDVNGDGYDDISIGISKFDNGQTDEGKLVLFYGSAGAIGAIPNWSFESNTASALLGSTLASGSDINGDNYDELIAGAVDYEESTTTEEIGKAWIFHGSSTGLPSIANFEIEGTDEFAHLGNSVGYAGDVNNDGYADIFVAASAHDEDYTSAGKVIVYYGSESGLSDANKWENIGRANNELFGSSCSGGGDFNNDGFDDFIVGAMGHLSNKGAVYFYSGGPDGLNIDYTTLIEFSQVNGYAGCSVSMLKDINNDTYDDLAIGAYLYDNGSTDEGLVFFYYGQDAFPTSLISLPETNQENAQLGFSVTSGNINDDYKTDLVVSAPYFDGGLIDEGKIFIFLNNTNWSTITSYTLTIEGEQAGALFGFSISAGKDLNADGYTDIIVGAPGYDGGQTDEGKLYVYAGQSYILDATPDWTFESNQIGAQLGLSVAGIGDINGDYVQDFCASAPFYTGPILNQGKVYIFSGGVTIPATPLYEIVSDQTNCNFGGSLSSGGDINNDGLDDFIIGAPNYDNILTNAGRAYIYYGSDLGLNSIDPTIISGDQSNGYFATSVNTALDVNSDSFSDIIIGAPNFDHGETDEGVAFIYYGSASGINATQYTLIEKNKPSAAFGFCAGPAFDWNSDGFDDIYIGAPLFSGLLSNEGIVYIFPGGPDGIIPEPISVYSAGQSNAQFGYSAIVGFQFSDDTIPDIVIGAPFYDNTELNEGAVFYFENTLNPTTELLTDGITLPYYYGAPGILGNNDFNGDGYEDLLLKLPSLTNPENTEGGAAAFYGDSLSNYFNHDWLIQSNNDFNYTYANNLTNVGDINNDGFEDLAWGLHAYSNPQSAEGIVYLFYGSALGLPATHSLTIEANASNRHLGASFCNSGDINGDGIDDLVIGCGTFSASYSNGQTDEGAVYVYFGSVSGISPTPSQIVESNVVNKRFGEKLFGAGDVNNDGYDDVIITSYANETVGLHFGSPTGLSATPSWTMTPEVLGTLFGTRFGCTDFNNDGFSDLLTSASAFDNIETNEGKLYLYYGGATGYSTTPDWTIESNFGADYSNGNVNFGTSFTVNCDFNNDGFKDIIVSLNGMDSEYNPYYAPSKYNIGEIRLYLGSDIGFSNVPAIKWRGEKAYQYLGSSITYAGDLNNDGFGDFLSTVAAPNAINVYYGYDIEARHPDNMVQGDQADAHFGEKVFPAGDINNDGYGDLLVTSPDFKNYNGTMGKVQLFYGNPFGVSSIVAWELEGNSEISQVSTVFPVGDINYDSYYDIIVGLDNGEKIALFLGSALGLKTEPNQLIDVPDFDVDSYVPRYLGCGDVNGDHFGDVVISLGNANYAGTTKIGIAYLYYGSPTGLNVDPAWQYTGEVANDEFGRSNCVADVNGDGFSDVIIGAPRVSAGLASNTYCKAFYGSAAGLSLTPDWTVTKGAGDGFGKQIYHAGDLNDDGFDDIIISNSSDYSSCTYPTNAVYYGSATGLPMVASWTLNSSHLPPGRFNALTTGLLPAGDINTDGYDDVMVMIGKLHEIHYLFGSSSGLSTYSDYSIDHLATETFSEATYDDFCNAFQCVGDLTGDGLPDAVIGNQGYNNGSINSGIIVVKPGSFRVAIPEIQTSLESNQPNAQAGYSVSIIGDVNGDGFADAAIGIPFYDNGQANEGKVDVYYGTENGILPTPDWTAESNKANSNFGNSVSGAGDVNGDGYDDLIIGANKFSHGESKEGGAYIYLGSPLGLESTFSIRLESNQANAGFGISVADAGDINADGFDDILIGADKFDNGQTDEGRVFIYLGASDGISPTADFTFENNKSKSNFGYKVARGGDINGDGYGDILIGSPKYSGGQSKEGAIYAYFGSATGISGMPWKFESNQVSGNLGAAICAAGDINADGFADIIAGADYYNYQYTDDGSIFVFNGMPTGLPLTPSQTLSSGKANARFGFAVSGGGDINSDGYDDIAVGAILYNNNQTAEGKIFIYAGSPEGIDMQLFWSYESNIANANLGFDLDLQGDINMDGFADLLGGMPLYTNTESLEGGALIIMGNGLDNRKNAVQFLVSDFSGPTNTASIPEPTVGLQFTAYGNTKTEKLVWELVNAGQAFSTIPASFTSNSTEYSDMTDTISMVAPENLINGLATKTGTINKFRLREEYSATNYPTLQKYGVWRYPGSPIFKGPVLKMPQTETDYHKNLNLMVFPNPTHDNIEWKLTGIEDSLYTVYVIDLSGKIIACQVHNPGSANKFEIKTLPVGYYFLTIVINHEMYTAKFIKLN